jgi:hypothetical protein
MCHAPDLDVLSDCDCADFLLLTDTDPTVDFAAPASVPAMTPTLLLVSPADILSANWEL